MRKAAGLALVVVGALTGSAGAQDKPSIVNEDSFDLLAQAAAKSHAGDHMAAIELYERVYRQESSMDLLVTIGNEYRKAGKADEALQNYCAYLAIEPNGDEAVFAAGEVASLEIALGRAGGGVCVPGSVPTVPAEPMLPPIMPPAVRQGPPTTNSSLSQRELAGIVTGAAGLVGLATGIYYGAQSKDISDQISNHSPATPWPSNIKDLERDGQHYETMQNIFLVGGAIATGVGVYLTVTGHAHRIANERISVSPELLQQGGGLAVSGGF
ncbi:MAG TPA: tetratricopeptide repeat protein [Kofleriaceae bacterium]|nr:tetratricopeptide repeat protein [Kofleriaceae bacterium]